MLMWAGEQGRSEEFTAPSLTDEQVAALRKKATPFVTWLEEADEEDGDDDEEEVGMFNLLGVVIILSTCFSFRPQGGDGDEALLSYAACLFLLSWEGNAAEVVEVLYGFRFFFSSFSFFLRRMGGYFYFNPFMNTSTGDHS